MGAEVHACFSESHFLRVACLGTGRPTGVGGSFAGKGRPQRRQDCTQTVHPRFCSWEVWQQYSLSGNLTSGLMAMVRFFEYVFHTARHDLVETSSSTLAFKVAVRACCHEAGPSKQLQDVLQGIVPQYQLATASCSRTSPQP